jgi:two-component system sensor histidine kinase CpxA
MQVALYSAGRSVCGSRPALNEAAYRPLLASADEEGTAVNGRGHRAGVLLVRGRSGANYVAAAAEIPGAHHGSDRRPFPFVFLLTVTIISGAACLLVARNLTRPLTRMREAADSLREGNLSARAGTGLAARNDEIGDVVRDFDAMAERIESLLGAQKQLLSDISHELRSPLARLNVALELARRTSGPAASTHLARIVTEAERMNELIGKVLALARAENAGRSVHRELFDLEEVVQRVAEDAEYEARRMGCAVTLAVRGKATINGDPGLVASAVENVVRNAIRYTPPESAVEIALAVGETDAQISVRDHGTGVPDDELERVFLPFHRIGPARDRESGGTGLGLSIAHRAVTSQGGSISAENVPGGGLRVVITLPLAPAGQAAVGA